ncbi:NLP/P60 domain-containing protein [Heterostelium album PN500]|uniref:NLP/P60 domain-containing protein n=1 Tax=Heterostelium pallidum (strain ATCC 26659 / Pp 5 / PN500) TaxID=670386 RepID=D3BQC8_HETP5|nr:NLP/P60 domain-containing protein [Heterostelium album PN500]EFA76348.1 NLP/P60 domain-containing protein [Heterostelium album PN500]|eukprot:XP_020428480.1 NLP/P60 domain-containing protein [Heterostelium album PN500]
MKSLYILVLIALVSSCFVSATEEVVDIEQDFDAFNTTENIHYYLEKFGKLPLSTCQKAAARASHYSTCGCPYVYGGTSCGCGSGGLDCSGLVYRSYNDAGWSGIGRTTFNQIGQGGACNSKCSPSNPGACTVGDLFFYCFAQPCPSHVVMYIGGGKAAECPYTGLNCRIITPYATSYQTCRSMCG